MKAGWQTVTVGELGRVFNGNSISEAEKKANFEGLEEGVPYIGTKNVSFDHEIEYETGVKIPGEKQGGFKLAPANTVFICAEGGSAGRKIAHTDREVFFGNKLYAISPTHFNSSRFVFYYCLSDDFAKQFKSAMAGLIGGVSMNKFKELNITLPPLSEQQRIVAILDEVFDGIATAKANTEKNLQNARALFESHLQSVFTQRGEGWMEKALGDVCEFENGDRGKNYPNRNEYVESGIPWINTGHIQPDGTLSTDEMNFITQKKFDSLRSGKIQPGDLVYCLRGATLGKTALVAPLTEGAVASSLVIVRPSAILDSRFLYFFLTSPHGQGLIRGFENGAAQPNLGARSVAKYPISFPTAKEQKGIADRLMVFREETQRLESLYQRKLAALAELKKSLLHQAFSGML
ncbi:MAG: restriction endonuclease subunit S [Sideroxydans sp.]|nr:restriction endonuclease subunit S [Sideroxydans sp.]